MITLGADNPPLTWLSYEGLQTATGFEKERDELNLLYPNTDSGKAAVENYIETLEVYNRKVAALLAAGDELPDELANAPAFPQRDATSGPNTLRTRPSRTTSASAL